jgi:hypothetical protein
MIDGKKREQKRAGDSKILQKHPCLPIRLPPMSLHQREGLRSLPWDASMITISSNASETHKQKESKQKPQKETQQGEQSEQRDRYMVRQTPA